MALKVPPKTTLKTSGGGFKSKSTKPSFSSLMGEHPAEVAPSPLESLEYPGDVEGNAKTELVAIESFIKEERKKKRDQYRVMVDPEYWVCLCFQSREQKEEFLDKVKWLDLGEKYLDGLEIARRLGVSIQPIPLTGKAPPKAAKSLREEVNQDGGQHDSTTAE